MADEHDRYKAILDNLYDAVLRRSGSAHRLLVTFSE